MSPNYRVLICVAGQLLGGAWSQGAGPARARSEFVFPLEGRPTPQCHAATVVELNGGTIAAAWFGGSREGAADVGVWFSRLEKGGWTKPAQIADGTASPAGSAETKRYACWNPVLYQDGGGPLLLFYKVGPSPAAWWGMMRTSPDGGRAWSPARRLPDGILGPIKNKPVALPGGVLLCPSSTEEGGWRSHLEWTADLGKTWSRSADLVSGDGTIEAIQPCLLVHPGGRLQALGRTRQGRIFEAWSGDGGKTWGPMRLTALPNPNSGIDAVTLKNGRHILIYNPGESGRTPLVAAVSKNGADWETIATLEDGPGEYSRTAKL